MLLIATIAIGLVAATFAFTTQNSTVKTISKQGTHTDTFSTTISAWTIQNPAGTNISINGVPYLNGNYYTTPAYTQTTTGYSLATGTGSDSVFNLSLGNFYAGGYIGFNVTITNTGNIALLFTTYSLSCYFSNDNGAYVAPPAGYGAGYNLTYQMNNSNFENVTLANYTANGVTNPGFLYYLDYLWSDNWVAWAGTALGVPVPTSLAPGASFTYTIFIGLGATAPYNLPDMYYSIEIPLIPATAP